jgi:hypothetical protein
VEETGDTSAQNLFIISFILLLVFSLICAGILNANSNIGAYAFAKKSSKTSPNIDSNVRNGLGDGGSGRDGTQQYDWQFRYTWH